MSRRTLRVGILIDGDPQIPRWVEKVLSSAPFPDRATLAAVVILPEDASAPGGPVVRLYAWFDRWRYARATDATAFVDGASVLSGAPRLNVASLGGIAASGNAPLMDALVAADLDVLVDFTGRAPAGLGGGARRGMWALRRAGEGEPLDVSHAGLNEVLAGAPVARLELVAWTREGVSPIDAAAFRTDVVSAQATRSDMLWQAAHLISGAINAAACETATRVHRAHSNSGTGSPGGVVARPAAWQVGRLGGRYVARQLVSRSQFEQWFIAYRFDGGTDLVDAWSRFDFASFTPLVPPRDRFWADPFVVASGGRHFVFFEELLYCHGRGWISVMELGAEGVVAPAVPVLQAEHHLSYPFVFRHEDAWYMIPETAQRRRVELYRAERFPHQWVLDRVLLEGAPLVDATIARIGDRWWMFAGRARDSERSDNELHLYHAPSPLGPWVPHGRSPVLRDVSCSRPAGALFEQGGVWYRPVQDGSRSYGGALRLQRVVRIDPDQYEEETVLQLAPGMGSGLVGMHTWNRDGGLTVVDGRRRRWKPFSTWGRSRP